MCPLQINDFSPEVRSDVAEFFAETEPLVLKITNDFDPELYWSFESDSDCLRERIEAEDNLYRSWEELGEVLSLRSLRECADRLYKQSTCISPAVQLTLDFRYD